MASKKTAKPGKSKSEFIRENLALSNEDIIEAGKKQGLQINKELIYAVRTSEKKKARGGAKKLPGVGVSVTTIKKTAKKAARKAPSAPASRGSVDDAIRALVKSVVEETLREKFG